jgi:glycosyltransferase involved in cell wall biosynthesis
MTQTKVLFVTAWYPTTEQPVAGIFVREHARAVRQFADVVVLHITGADPNLRQPWRIERESDPNLTDGIPTYRVWHRRSPLPKTNYLMSVWSTLRAVRHILDRGFRPDVIHAHIYTAGAPAVLAGKLNRIPVVVTEHYSVFLRHRLRGLDLLKCRMAFQGSKAVLPVSRALQRAIEACGIKARFEVVPNVVDTKLFTPGETHRPDGSQKHLLFVGLLDAFDVKRLPDLLRALSLLQEQRTDWRLDVVGDGPMRPDYEALAQELKLAEKVEFHGLKSKPEVAAFMRRADLFVLPSRAETFGTVAAEALATGTPVLATRCGGPEEFVTEAVGKLVPPDNAAALCCGLDEMLDNLDRYSPEQIAAYATQQFSHERVGAQLHAIYKAVRKA